MARTGPGRRPPPARPAPGSTAPCPAGRSRGSSRPGPTAGRGRPHKHGRRFKLRDGRTHGRPDRSASLEHPVYGSVSVAAWTTLHAEHAAGASFTVIRVHSFTVIRVQV